MNKNCVTLAVLFSIFSCSSKNEEAKKSSPPKDDSTETTVAVKTKGLEKNQQQHPTDRIAVLCNEQIDGPANIRSSPNGKLLFELFDTEPVETTPIENDWLMVSAFVQLDSTELNSGIILPNKKLRNVDGKTIGNSFDTLELIFYDEAGGMIWGHTYKNNIRPNCTPEAQLNELIIANKLSFDEQQEYREFFGYTPFNLNSVEGVSEYIIYQSTIVDPSPRDRISLMYYDSKLIAFVHYRDFDFYNLQSGELIRGHKIVFLNNKNPVLSQEIVENRIDLYNHSD